MISKYLCPECHQELYIISYPEFHNEYRDLHFKCENCGFRTRKVSGYTDYDKQLDKLIKEYNIIADKEDLVEELPRSTTNSTNNLKNAFNSDKWFKRPCWNLWFRRQDDVCVENSNNIKDIPLNTILSVEDIFAEDYVIRDELEEKWWEGNFKKKYPNGVLCWVGNDKDHLITKIIIVDYYPVKKYFLDDRGIAYRYAEPVRPEEAPIIIDMRKDTNEQ